jgi:hypothetical protein
MAQYGSGLAGSGGYVPDLSGKGDPIYGGEITLDLTQGLGGTEGLMYAGLSPASLPILGGELLVFPIEAVIPIALQGSPGVPGDGSFSIGATTYFADLSLYFQVFLVDPGAPMGVSMSKGLEIVYP